MAELRHALVLPAPAQFEALRAGWLWLPAERVACRKCGGSGCIINYLGDELACDSCGGSGERLVSPYVPDTLLPKPCGDCGGCGADYSKPLTVGTMEPATCPSCGGEGVTAEAWHAGVASDHGIGWGRWCDECKTYGSHHTDRHDQFGQALVARVRLIGQPIPVVDDMSTHDDMVFIGNVLGVDGVHIRRNGRWDILVEPWAQGLQVGDFLAPVEMEMLDEPITHYRRTHRSGGDYDGAWNDLPLSLVPGTWEEIA